MTIYVALSIAVVFLSLVALYRLIVGPNVFDRILAAGAIGANAIGLLVLIGFVFERPDMFVDMAIAYSLLIFVGSVIIAKYLDREGL